MRSRLGFAGLMCAALLLSSCSSPSPLPLDVTPTGGVDENGFDLNPTWASQISQGSAFSLANPAACAPSGSAQDDPRNWYTGANPCTHFHVTTDRRHVAVYCGPHVNWFPVTYQADSVAWESHAEPGADDDYNIDLLRNDHALYGADKPVTAQLYSEFDSDETIDHFNTAWWQEFHSIVDDEGDNAAKEWLAADKGAIAIGLLGLDAAHGPGSVELHPIYVLAIHVNDDLKADHWAFFARNKADEGYCSSYKESMYPLTQTGDAFYTYKLLLPPPRANAGNPVFIKKDVRLYGKGKSVDAGSVFGGNAVLNKGMVLNFTLPNPDQQQDSDEWVIEGDIELSWVLSPAELTVTLNVAPPIDPGTFDVLIDGTVKAAGLPSGGSTGPLALDKGAHIVSGRAAAGTDPSQYSATIGGDCKPDGSIALANGDSKACTITYTRKGGGNCVSVCEQNYRDCLSSGLTPKECSDGQKNCLQGCR